MNELKTKTVHNSKECSTMLMEGSMDSIIRSLAGDRKLFHSEADFQHSLAWKIQDVPAVDEISLRLEYPVRLSDKSITLDILANCSGKDIPIELKYKTSSIFRDSSIPIHCDGEAYYVTNQARSTEARKDFFSDVCRVERTLETLVDSNVGYVILLTNNPRLHSDRDRSDRYDGRFRLYEGRICEQPISLEGIFNVRGKYTLHWKPYSDITSCSPEPEINTTFHYLLLRVQI